MFRTLPRPLLVLYVFICCTAILEVWSSVLHSNGEDNMMLFRVHTYIEFVTFSVIYFMITQSRYIRNYIVILSTIFIIGLIYTDSTVDVAGQLNTRMRVFESIILISYLVLYILKIFRKSNSPFIELQPYFMLTCGLLAYFLGTLLVYLYYDYLEGQILMMIWAIHSILNLVLNLIYVVAIWRNRKVSHS